MYRKLATQRQYLNRSILFTAHDNLSRAASRSKRSACAQKLCMSLMTGLSLFARIVPDFPGLKVHLRNLAEQARRKSSAGQKPSVRFWSIEVQFSEPTIAMFFRCVRRLGQ
jgi:hypothetical protein